MKKHTHLLTTTINFTQDSIDKINSFSSKINSFINDEINTNEVAK